MSKPRPQSPASIDRAYRNRLLPPAGGSPRVDATEPRQPEPYFVVGGRERSGFRNVIAAVRAAHPGAAVLQTPAAIVVVGADVLYRAHTTPRVGRHFRALG